MVRLLLVAALLPLVSSTAQATAPDAARPIPRTAVSAPSAGQILFERIAARDGDCYGSIWTVAAAGSEQQHSSIASGKGDCDAAWARDGTLIAFASRREGGIARIFVANADGTAQRQLTNSPYDDFLPDWSPDGSQIIFERFFAPDDYELFVMNSDGSALHRLWGGPGYDGTPKWSPDGTLVLFASDRPKPGRPNCSDCSALYLMHPDGTGLRRITKRTVDSLMPAWSPDGSLLRDLRILTPSFKICDSLPEVEARSVSNAAGPRQA